MSRLLRKGAVIGKAALVLVVAGLLLYGAVTLLKAELAGGEADTSRIVAPIEQSSEQVSAYLAAAEGELEAGNAVSAYEVTKQMIEYVPASEEAGAAAEQIAAKLAKARNGEQARELYLYATKCATGTSLRKALCGLAEVDAVEGDGRAAYAAVVRLGEEFAGDAEAVKAINRVGERYLSRGFSIRSRDVYRVAADKWAGTEHGMEALGAMGLASVKVDDYEGAVATAMRLQSEYPADEQAQRLAIQIAHKFTEWRLYKEAGQIFDSLEAGSPSERMVRDIVVGRAVMAILQGDREYEDNALAFLAGSESPDSWACTQIAGAYYNVHRYEEVVAVFGRMIELKPGTPQGRTYESKIAKCGVLLGDAAMALDAVERLSTQYPEMREAGKHIFDVLVLCVIEGQHELAWQILARSRELCPLDADRKWLDAAQAGLTISFDPASDVTAVMSEFAAGWGGTRKFPGMCLMIARMCHRSALRELIHKDRAVASADGCIASAPASAGPAPRQYTTENVLNTLLQCGT